MIQSSRGPVAAKSFVLLTFLLVVAALSLVLAACERMDTDVSVTGDQTNESVSSTRPADTTDTSAATSSTDARTETTLSQADLMLQVVDALESGDHIALKTSWSQSIENAYISRGELTETDVNALIWEAISGAGLADRAGIDSLAELERAMAGVKESPGLAELLFDIQNNMRDYENMNKLVAQLAKEMNDMAMTAIDNLKA